jgi:hypothetical protein
MMRRPETAPCDPAGASVSELVEHRPMLLHAAQHDVLDTQAGLAAGNIMIISNREPERGEARDRIQPPNAIPRAVK